MSYDNPSYDNACVTSTADEKSPAAPPQESAIAPSQQEQQPYYPPPSYYPPQQPSYPLPQQPYAFPPQQYPPPQYSAVPPVAGYPTVPQQQSSVVVNAGQQQPQVIYVMNNGAQSFCAHIALACFVVWCCGWMFGIIAFILAMMAQDRSSTGRNEEARQLGRASIGLSIAGIVVGVIVVAIIIGVSLSNVNNAYVYPNNNYPYYGNGGK